MAEMPRERVFVARRASDEERVEALLREENIEYIVSLEGAGDAEPGAVCFLAMVYEVPRPDAERARAALSRGGLAAGIVSG